MPEEYPILPKRKKGSTMKLKIEAMARHILQERKRLGGNFVVAYMLESKELRDVIKEIIGPDTIFIILCINAELYAKRIEHRLG